ncbi:MAG TPA: carboxypeptidase-like regulatory domain-containing protein [Methanocella sp.]|uniref:carboxypeptidase-like regulatory domain-containing protein n=1 Tax=Methanocella sp. TaxID=2052833 RepID=UPI002B770883|nr:carboxypeptidase-like regulatory domain-containing protein [Methanocella sp.]HTY91054.1 carboxypeptidase-like regulatory domain-containing protein [Methanocella sp.]
MARSVIKLLLIFLIAGIFIVMPALAFMPSERGASYPHTVYLDRGIKGSVSGKVVSSLDQAQGVEGAYVAVVDVQSPGREYANTTTDSSGNFNIGGLGATYSSNRHTGADGSAGTLEQSMNMFMLYVNKSDLGEGYSSTFGIDANHTSTIMGNIVLYAGSQGSEGPTATPEPTAQPKPTVVVPTVYVPTPEPSTVTPEPAGLAGQIPVTLIVVVALLAILAIAAVVVYFRFLRKGLMRRLKKK